MVNFGNNGSPMILILNGFQNILAVIHYSLRNYYLKKLNTYLHDFLIVSRRFSTFHAIKFSM